MNEERRSACPVQLSHNLKLHYMTLETGRVALCFDGVISGLTNAAVFECRNVEFAKMIFDAIQTLSKKQE